MKIEFNSEEIALTMVAIEQAIDRCIDYDLGTERLNKLEDLLKKLEDEIRIV